MRLEGLRTPEARLAGVLSVLVVGVRLWMARPLTFCGTPDACYYLGMAQTLASGGGFHTRFLYDFQQAHPTLPNTGVEYWRPGISLLLMPLRYLGGVTLHSSILVTTLVGVVFAAAAWHIAMRAYGDRRLALGSFALCLLSSSAWIGSLSPDSGLPYGAAVTWFLALFTVRRQGLLQDILALGCVGAAYLIRNDAALLLLPLLGVLWQRHRNASRGGDSARRPGSSVPYAIAMLLGFMVALLPMHLLYRAILGTAFPSGTAQALYLNDLSDFVRYNEPVSRHSLLAHGLKHLLLFRIGTFATVVYRIAVLMIGYAALVFLPGLFLRNSDTPRGAGGGAEAYAGGKETAARSLPELTGAAVFFVAALLAYTLILPAVGGFSALRTATGMMPLAFVLVMVAIRRVARTPRLATALAVAVIGANALSGLMEDRRDVVTMNETGAGDRFEAQGLAALGANPASAVVLTGDPVQFSVTSGYATVALPVNGLDAITQAAHDFGATHVIFNTEDLPGSMGELDSQLHPVRSTLLPAEHSLILALGPEPGDH